MIISAVLSALHVLTLALGLGAVVIRGRALARPLDEAGWRQLLAADTAWGIAAGLWIATGLARVLVGGKEPSFYWYNGFFWVKMGMFASVFALEIVPMLTLVRWRAALGRGAAVDTSGAALLARINTVEMVLVLLIPFAAAAMARGLWLFT